MIRKEVVLVLGKQLLPNGSLSKELKLQMRVAVEMMHAAVGNLLVISGGVTRPGFPAEAEVAAQLLPKRLYDSVLLEPTAMSTKQNVVNVKKLLSEYDIARIFVVTSAGHRQRVFYCFKKYWPEIVPDLYFEDIELKQTWFEKIVHKAIYFMTVIDPNEKFFLPCKRLWFNR